MCFQVDAVKNLSESFAYVSFGIVLFVWEVLPISVVVIFFRVKRQSSAVVSKYDRWLIKVYCLLELWLFCSSIDTERELVLCILFVMSFSLEARNWV